MTDNELRKLNREELLEILLEQKIEIEKMKLRLEDATRALEERQGWMESMGTVAAAVYRVEAICERMELDRMKEMFGSMGARDVAYTVPPSQAGGQENEGKQ
jgi:hypothetical protein